MDKLPKELLCLVFSHLPPYAQARLSLVCKEWFYLIFGSHTHVRIHTCEADYNEDGKLFSLSLVSQGIQYDPPYGPPYGTTDCDWALFGLIYRLLGNLPNLKTLELDLPDRAYTYSLVNNLVFPAVTSLIVDRSASVDYGSYAWMCRCFPNVENLNLRFERNVWNSSELLKTSETVIVPATVSTIRMTFFDGEHTRPQAPEYSDSSLFPSVCENPANIRQIWWFGSLHILPGLCFSSFSSLTHLSLANRVDTTQAYKNATGETLLGALSYCQDTLTSVHLDTIHISQDTLRLATCGKNIRCLSIQSISLDRGITLGDFLAALCPNVKHLKIIYFAHLRTDDLRTMMNALRGLEFAHIAVSMSFSKLVPFETRAFENILLSCGWCVNDAQPFKRYAGLDLELVTDKDAGYFEAGGSAHDECPNKCRKRVVDVVRNRRYTQDPTYCQGKMFQSERFQSSNGRYSFVSWTTTVPDFLQSVETKFANFRRI